MSDLHVEYRQCLKRGHVAKSYITHGIGPTKGICKYCGTLFWTTTVEHEENAPQKAEQEVAEDE